MSSSSEPGPRQRLDPGASADASASFTAALAAISDVRMAGPELLPARLARAAATVLSVDAAGISVLAADLRVPLGASAESAAIAERLQFTHGEGPCLEAVHRRRPIVADRAELHRRWPLFTEELLDRTPYQAIITLPLHIGADTWGATDLYLTGDSRLGDVRLAQSVTVADEIVQALQMAAAAPAPPSPLFDQGRPAWLQGPAARDRTIVWVAIGMMMTQLDVSSPDALAVLRSYAYTHDQMLDDLSADLAYGRIPVGDLDP